MAALARVEPFISGLKEPQGLALDENGDVLLCDSAAGEVARFDDRNAFKKVEAKRLKEAAGISFFAALSPINFGLAQVPRARKTHRYRE